MKFLKKLSFMFLILIFTVSVVFADQYHTAADVRPGTFNGRTSSLYTFPGIMRLNNYLIINSYLGTYGTGNARIYYDGVGGSGSSTGYLAFGIGSSDYLYITNSGNVGIGTSTPSYKLQIRGGVTRTRGGLVIETRSSNPPTFQLQRGRIWLLV